MQAKRLEDMSVDELRRVSALMKQALEGLEGSARSLTEAWDEGQKKDVAKRLEVVRKARQFAMLVLWQVQPNGSDRRAA